MLSSGASTSDSVSRSGDASEDDGNSSDGNSSDASQDASAADAARALFVSAVERDALSSLSRTTREAVAGATACVCAGLDGDGDAALDVLRLVVIDALALDEANLRAVQPLVTAPASLEDLNRGVQSARDAFVRPFEVKSPATETPFEGDTERHKCLDAGRDDPVAAREPIDWSVVIASLIVKTAAIGKHDARVSACFKRLSVAARINWRPVAAFEDLLARKLRDALDENETSVARSDARETSAPSSPVDEKKTDPLPRRDAWRDVKISKKTRSVSRRRKDAFSFSAMRATVKDMGYGRAAAVGAAAAFGGGLMFVTGGAAAPAVLASLASLSAAGGLIGAVALSAGTLVSSFGGATGIAYALGGVGAGLTGWRFARRLEGLSQFAFLPLRGTDEGMRVFLYVPGFLRDPGDLFKSFGKRDGVYSAVVEVPADRSGSERTGVGSSERTSGENPGTRGENSSGKKDEAEAEAEAENVEPKTSPWRVLSDAVALRSLTSLLFDTSAGETDGDVNGEETKCLRDEAKNASSSVDVSSVGLRLDVVGDGEVFVSSVVPGGIADAAGVAEGSVLVSAAFVRDDDESSSSDDDDDDDDDECASKEDEDSKDSSKHEDSKAKKKKESSSFLRCGAGAGDARAVAALFARAAKKKSAAREGGERRPSRSVELRLRRNLSRGADVDALARRRARRVAESENGAGTEKLDALASTNPLSSKSTASLGETLDSGSGGVAENLGSPRDVNQSSVSRAWPLPRGAQFVVAWEHALLMDLGGAMSAFGRAAMTRYVGAQAVAHTSLAALASAVAWPVTLLNAGGFIDSPWALAEARSKDAGRALAKALLEGSASGARRPVTIVAYSLGCDVVRAACACLLEAEEEAISEARNRNADRSTGRREDESEEASDTNEELSKEKKNAAPRNEKSGLGLIQDLVFVGAPLDASFETWSCLAARHDRARGERGRLRRPIARADIFKHLQREGFFARRRLDASFPVPEKNLGASAGRRGVDARGPPRGGERGRGRGVRRARRDPGQNGRHPAGRGAGRVTREGYR
jgi:hypothetical protein